MLINFNWVSRETEVDDDEVRARLAPIKILMSAIRGLINNPNEYVFSFELFPQMNIGYFS